MNPSAGQPDLRHPALSVIPLAKSRAFTVSSHCEPSYRFLWHFHPEWELVFNHSGRGIRHVGSSVERFGPGDLVLVPPNVARRPRRWRTTFSVPAHLSRQGSAAPPGPHVQEGGMSGASPAGISHLPPPMRFPCKPPPEVADHLFRFRLLEPSR